MSERDSVLVWAVDEPEVVQDYAAFVCEDERLNEDGTTDGSVKMHLSNGRRLHIAKNGIWDMDDIGDTPLHEVNAAFVPWEELLQLLDAWREMSRQAELN